MVLLYSLVLYLENKIKKYINETGKSVNITSNSKTVKLRTTSNITESANFPNTQNICFTNRSILN